ncbi:hypothetical protein TSAR_010323 [Trichomalopsis sarcophagae]|uniref:Uncharacterized protein n=1 Tax=Trichomalopsis sarcophagae TaxID=543379 RepID=A0A232EKZ9_9HYME|nr:hypothetical protein TSAR_010323 [Trichomalopsis sarcophagae]
MCIPAVCSSHKNEPKNWPVTSQFLVSRHHGEGKQKPTLTPHPEPVGGQKQGHGCLLSMVPFMKIQEDNLHAMDSLSLYSGIYLYVHGKTMTQNNREQNEAIIEIGCRSSTVSLRDHPNLSTVLIARSAFGTGGMNTQELLKALDPLTVKTVGVCGQYCVMFLYHMVRLPNLRTFCHKFSRDSRKNDAVDVRRFGSETSRGSGFYNQTCLKH